MIIMSSLVIKRATFSLLNNTQDTPTQNESHPQEKVYKKFIKSIHLDNSNRVFAALNEGKTLIEILLYHFA